jgi:hypothetical protein
MVFINRFAKGFFRREPIKGLDCAIGIRRVTIPGEVVRIDFNLDDLGSLPLRDEVALLAKLAIEPRLVSFRKVVLQDSEEGVESSSRMVTIRQMGMCFSAGLLPFRQRLLGKT